jgi:hypothetical protein
MSGLDWTIPEQIHFVFGTFLPFSFQALLGNVSNEA